MLDNQVPNLTVACAMALLTAWRTWLRAGLIRILYRHFQHSVRSVGEVNQEILCEF